MATAVLVVDDDPTFLVLMARILDELGVAVETARDAAQAVLVANETKPRFVLVDVGLPDRSGIDLAYELADLPWGPQVVLTSNNSEASAAIERADERGVPIFIAKGELESETLSRMLSTG